MDLSWLFPHAVHFLGGDSLLRANERLAGAVDYLNGTNVWAVKPMLPVSYGHTTDRTLASLSGVFWDPDL
jgi:hypothetical protein